MPDLSNDPAGYAISFLTGLVPFFIYLLANQRKKLGYAITRNFEIVTLNDQSMAGQISILVSGKEKKGVRSTQIVFQNIGIKDIENQDVDISFPHDVEIMNWSLAFDPPADTPGFKLQKSSLRITIGLMNPGDKLIFNFLTGNNLTGSCRIHARAPGFVCKRFDPAQFVSPVINWIVNGAVLLSWCWITVGYIIWQMEKTPERPLWARILFTTFLAIMSAFIAVVFRDWAFRAIRLSKEVMNKVAQYLT